MSSTATVQPYHNNSVFTHQFPYEGFTDLEYSSSNPNINDMAVTNLLLNNPNKNHCKRVHGIDGLFCKPFLADSRLDRFSEAKGDHNCFGKSSGLSNSKGSLCLGSDLTQLLRTRGGNQTRGPDQYGN